MGSQLARTLSDWLSRILAGVREWLVVGLSTKDLTLSQYHELKAAEARRWNRPALENAVRSQDPAALDKIHAALLLTDRGYSKLELDLVQVEPAPLDQILRDLCELYHSGTPQMREYIRATVNVQQAGAFLVFSERAAIIGARTHSAEMIRYSLIAQAIENFTATEDVRDNLLILALIYDCARRITKNPDALFEEVAKISGPAIANLLRTYQFPGLRPMAWTEVVTDKGVGYIWSGG